MGYLTPEDFTTHPSKILRLKESSTFIPRSWRSESGRKKEEGLMPLLNDLLR